jgi:hypothetical protein
MIHTCRRNKGGRRSKWTTESAFALGLALQSSYTSPAEAARKAQRPVCFPLPACRLVVGQAIGIGERGRQLAGSKQWRIQPRGNRGRGRRAVK